MILSSVWSHPVKSMLGHTVDAVEVGPDGMPGDRAYGFLDRESGRLASAKNPKRYGALLGCAATLIETPLAGRPLPPVRVRFPDGSTAEEVGEITRRVSALIGRDLQMVTHVPPGTTFEEEWPDIDGLAPEEFAAALEIRPHDVDGERLVGLPAGLATGGTMHDFAPLHLLTRSTLRAMAAAHPEGRWDERRFRPNLVVDDLEDAAGVAEDDWIGRDLLIGDTLRLRIVAPTPRCVMTTVPQAGLPKDMKILRTTAEHGLREFPGLGKFACAGVYAEVVTPGPARTGDRVRLTEATVPGPAALAAAVEMLAATLRPAGPDQG